MKLENNFLVLMEYFIIIINEGGRTMRASRWPIFAFCIVVLSLIVGIFISSGWSAEQQPASSPSELLELAVMMTGGGRAGFQLVRFETRGVPGPQFRPIKGLDSPDAVPFLLNVLNNGPDWTDEKMLKSRGGMYPHIARCYSALCLGVIGDKRAYEPLIKILQNGDYIEDKFEITYSKKDKYPISDYAAIALGYMGDPNAINPLIAALQNDSREWAVYGLTRLRDVRAIKPIVTYVSGRDRFEPLMHNCLEYISRARFRIGYSSKTRSYTVVDFPEMGKLKGEKIHKALWQHWLKEGDKFAKQQFEEYYPKWKLLRRERPDDRFSQGRVLFEMVRGGVPALPHIIDTIDKEEDESLLLAVESIRAPGGPSRESSIHKLQKNVTRAECLKWWNENKHKWLIFESEG